MKALVIVLLLSCLQACSSTMGEKKNKYHLLNDLWQERSTKLNVISVFGNGFQVVESGIVYNYPNSKYPEIGLFFDSKGKLIEQFVFMDEKSLDSFKSSLDCHWKETEEIKMMSHYHRIIKKGKCTKFYITYESNLDINAYEVRWKR